MTSGKIKSIILSPIKIPYITNEILFPSNIVAINLEGFFVTKFKNLAFIPVCFFSTSIKILLEDINAISIPEKKADNRIHIKIIRSDNIIFYFFFGY